MRRFDQALNTLQTVPTITAIRQMAEDIRTGELEKLLRRMDPALSPSDVKDMEAMTRAIVNKLLHAPTRYLKYTSDPERVSTVRDVFGIDYLSDEITQRKPRELLWAYPARKTSSTAPKGLSQAASTVQSGHSDRLAELPGSWCAAPGPTSGMKTETST